MKRSITIFIACLLSLLPFTKANENTDNKRVLQPLLANKVQDKKLKRPPQTLKFLYYFSLIIIYLAIFLLILR